MKKKPTLSQTQLATPRLIPFCDRNDLAVERIYNKVLGLYPFWWTGTLDSKIARVKLRDLFRDMETPPPALGARAKEDVAAADTPR